MDIVSVIGSATTVVSFVAFVGVVPTETSQRTMFPMLPSDSAPSVVAHRRPRLEEW